ncbi:MAG: MBL fold metallo-hydrolase [Clostridia bacterium]|nr:MBL fold metallo-hydrolase [Clostridia bacterium]
MKINDNVTKIMIPYKDIYTTVLIIKTDEGIVLFDTATHEEDVYNYILPSLKKEGIEKEDVKYIFISHNHGDHSGGLKWLAPLLPDAVILSNSPSLTEKYTAYKVKPLKDGEIVAGCLQHVLIPGHTPDAGGLLDLRSKTLMTGDALQVYGIYGSGKWGSNIKWPDLHLAALPSLHELDVEQLIMAHEYHPCGSIVNGKENIDRCIDDCAEALYKIKAAILADPNADDAALAANYNATQGLPTVGEKVFKAIRATIC